MRNHQDIVSIAELQLVWEDWLQPSADHHPHRSTVVATHLWTVSNFTSGGRWWYVSSWASTFLEVCNCFCKSKLICQLRRRRRPKGGDWTFEWRQYSRSMEFLTVLDTFPDDMVSSMKCGCPWSHRRDVLPFPRQTPENNRCLVRCKVVPVEGRFVAVTNGLLLSWYANRERCALPRLLAAMCV